MPPKRTRKPRSSPPKPKGKRAPASKPKRAARKPKGFSAVRLGSRIGNVFSPGLGRVGAEAGRLFRKVTGFGDYKVNSNTLVGSDPLPSFKNLRNGTRVIHREYLNDVITSSTSGGFSIQTVPIQPALLSSFPWLSASAENYQEYKLNGCIYEFKSNSYDALASTNTASGTVVMSTDYNVLDAPFPNKFQMEQSQYTCSAKPSRNLMHPIECAKLETPASVLFTRPGPVTTGDLRLYDWGNFYIATVGMQGTSVNVGELWVTYDITLLKPKLGSTTDVQDHYVLNPAGTLPAGTAYFGSATFPPILTLDSDMGTTLSVTAPATVGLNTINWPMGYTGNVVVIYHCSRTSVSSLGLAAMYTLVPSGGVVAIPAFGLGTLTSYFTNQQNSMFYNSNGGVSFVFFLSITNGGSIQLTGGGPNATLLSADLFICALPANFNTLGLPLITSTSHHQTTSDMKLPLLSDCKRQRRHIDVDIEDCYTDLGSELPPSSPTPSVDRKSSSRKSSSRT